MARYIATTGSQFEPFNYEQLIKPAQQLTEMHYATQDAYDALDADTKALGQYISTEKGRGDDRARKMYDDYNRKLESLQKELWDNGYTARARRGLSAARSAYASDISRLKTAIQSRQERSKEFWDAKHKNPNLVTSTDPGLAGLDAYLADENYGRDYFTTDAAEFERAMGEEWKSRASEILRGLNDLKSVSRNPALKDTLTRVLDKGITNAEADLAGKVVDMVIDMSPEDRKKFYRNNKVGDVVELLSESLINRYDATGIRNADVDAVGRQTLINRGKAGWAKGILASEVKDFSDPEYEMRMKKRLIDYQNTAKRPVQTGNGYTWNAPITSATSTGYDSLRKAVGNTYEQYQNGAVPIVASDGTTKQFSNPFEMSDYVYNSNARKIARSEFKGLDVALPAENFWGTTKSKQRNADGLTTGKLSDKDADRLGIAHGGVAIYGANGAIDDMATKRFNQLRDEHNAWVESVKESNPDFKFDKYAISPEQEKKLREKYNVDQTVDSGMLGSIVTTKETRGDYAPATLVGVEPGFDYARKGFGRMIDETFTRNMTKDGGGGSRFAFYKVDKASGKSYDEGETDKTKVFGRDTKGNPHVAEDTLRSITFRPEDVAAGSGNGRPRFQFTTTASEDMWSADVSMLGSQMENTLKRPVYGNGWSVCDAVDFMMGPIIRPEEAAMMDRNAAANWGQVVMTLLNTGRQSDLARLPLINDNGMMRMATATEILSNSVLRDKLYDSVREYIDSAVSIPRDRINNEHPQNVGNSSSNSPYYLPQM